MYLAVVPLGRGGPALALLKLNSLRPWEARRRRSSLTTAGQAPISNPLQYWYMDLRVRPLDRCWASALRCPIRCGKGRGIARAPKPAGLPAINHSAPHCGPGQVPVRWAMSATGSCSRLQNTQSAAHRRRCLVAVPAPVLDHLRRPTRPIVQGPWPS